MPELPERIVATPEALVECCQEVATAKEFGFDTEFVGEDSYYPELCLVQVATAAQLYLIDPLTAGPLDAFWKLVTDPARRVVVHAGREEIRLCHFGAGKPPGNLFDLQLAAGLVGLNYPIGHGPLIQQLLSVRLAKGETLTDWRRRPLSPQQVAYAFDDVRYLLPLAGKLTARLEKLGRVGWMREETDELIRRAVLENPAAEKWRKLRGVGSLDRKRLAVVRALYVWREEQAARHNRPSRVILRDDLVVEVARRNPTKERDLSVVRGLGHRDLESILRVVAEARALPPEQWPEAVERDFDPPQVALVGGLLQAVLGDLCARRELASSLVTTASELRGLVRARMQGPEPSGPLTKGWRAAEVLPVLQAVLDGRRAVGVRDLGTEAPLFEVPVEPRS